MKCPRVEKAVTLSLNYGTSNKGKKSAEDWLRAVGYSEEEIMKTAIGTFNGAVLGARSTSSQILLQNI